MKIPPVVTLLSFAPVLRVPMKIPEENFNESNFLRFPLLLLYVDFRFYASLFSALLILFDIEKSRRNCTLRYVVLVFLYVHLVNESLEYCQSTLPVAFIKR